MRDYTIETDITIIGAGPVGLFTVFEAGLLGYKCHLIDALPRIGGQLTELYPKKPIFDIPGFPSVLAQELVDNLEEQIKQFEPTYSLSEIAVDIKKVQEDDFRTLTDKGIVIKSKSVILAGGLGS